MIPQHLNTLSGYATEGKSLLDLFGRLKALRARYEGLGMSGAGLPADQFPAPGELDHIASKDQVTRFIALIDAFDGILSGPVAYTGADGQPHQVAGVACLVGVIR